MDATQKSIVAGIGVIAAAVLYFVVVNDPTDTEAEKDANTTATCAIAAASIPFFAQAVSQGRTSKAIEGLATAGTGVACKTLFDNLQQHPDAKAENGLIVVGSDGNQSSPQQVSLRDLIVPPPQPNNGHNLLACFQAFSGPNESLLLRLCWDGVIDPQG